MKIYCAKTQYIMDYAGLSCLYGTVDANSDAGESASAKPVTISITTRTVY
jgi:hypothetical protein